MVITSLQESVHQMVIIFAKIVKPADYPCTEKSFGLSSERTDGGLLLFVIHKMFLQILQINRIKLANFV